MASLVVLHGGRIRYLSESSVDDTWKAVAQAQGDGLALLFKDVDGRTQIVWPNEIEDVQDAVDLRSA